VAIQAAPIKAARPELPAARCPLPASPAVPATSVIVPLGMILQMAWLFRHAASTLPAANSVGVPDTGIPKILPPREPVYWHKAVWRNIDNCQTGLCGLERSGKEAGKRRRYLGAA
jgi:hypothetical protein